MRVLAVNAGSSSVKLSLLDGPERTLAERELQTGGHELSREQLEHALLGGLADADAVGHRIVHGGERFTSATLLDAGTECALRELTDLAPLHQRPSLNALDALREALPALPSVGCFDTAFHASLPEAARTYALPARWRERHSLRRFGFHGLSHAYIARRACQLLAREPTTLRIVSCHLGAGASLCAIAGGRSLDTTMGFTPLEGLVMATRSGDVDPGLLTWLMNREQLSPDQLADQLENCSGLLGLAGSADMREVQRAAIEGQPSSRLAFDVYIHRLRAAIAAMAAALGGLDVLVFTGGVGEHSAQVRWAACAGLGFLGVRVDEQRNLAAVADSELTAEGAGVATLLVRAREDLEIAHQVTELLAPRPGPGAGAGEPSPARDAA